MKLLRKVTNLYLGPWYYGVALNFGFSLLPLLIVIPMVLLPLVTLRQGFNKSIILLCGLLLLNSIFYYYIYNNISIAEFEISLDYAQYFLIFSILFVPIFSYALFLRYTVSLSKTIIFILLSCIVGLYFIQYYSLVPFSAKFEQIFVEQIFNHISNNYSATQAAGINKAQLSDLVKFIVNFSLIKELLVIYIVFLFLARFLQSALFNPSGFSIEFMNLRANKWLIIGLLLFIIISLALRSVITINIYFALGVMLLLFGYFVLMGLSFLHWLVYQYKLSSIYLWVFYILLILPISTMFCLLALLLIGVSDTVINLRKRLKV